MSFAATWIQIESTILSQKEKDKYYITYIWDLKHGKNELSTKQKQTQKHREQTRLVFVKREEDGLGVWD